MPLTIHLEPDVDARLLVEAAKRGLRKEEMAAALIGESLPQHSEGQEEDADYILRLTERIATTIPADALKDVPIDLSKNLDHYLYGQVKQE